MKINNSWVVAIAMTFSLLTSTYSSLAGAGVTQAAAHAIIDEHGGIVIPAMAEPKGFSLKRLAAATAAFNVTDRSGAVPTAINGRPFFQGLYTSADNPTNTFNVPQATWLYVPVIFADDSPPIIGNFPDVNDRNALVNYVYSHKELGVIYTNITVDGKVIPLNEDYLVGVKVAPLPDGGGTQYLTVAAILTPFKIGQHTVEISSLVTGIALCDLIACPPGFKFSTVYTVNVK